MDLIKTSTATVKDALWDAGIYDAKVSRLQNGTLRIRRSYYYRPTESLECFSQRIQLTLAPLGYKPSRVADEWAAYPKTSYYTVELRSRD